MGKKLKIIQIGWWILGSKALVSTVTDLIRPLASSPLATQILDFIDNWKISKLLGLPGNANYIDLFIATLAISIALLARKVDEEEL